MPVPRLLCLDPAAVMGWCFGVAGEDPVFGRARPGPRGCSLGEALARTEDFIEEKIAEFEPTNLIFEAPYIPVPRQPRFTKSGTFAGEGKGPPPMNADTVVKLACLKGIIEKIAWQHRLPCHEVTPQQAAKFFTGHGRWGGREQKKAATIAMAKRFGWRVQDDNEADALAIFCLAESILAPMIRRGAGPAPTMML